MKLLRQLQVLFRRDRLDAEMQAEMRMHLELQAERNREAGMDAEEARYAAEREFGNVASIQERAREGRGRVWWEQCCQDFRFAVRQLRRSPAFAAFAVISLALAIGSNTAIFSLCHEVILKPLPVLRPTELVLFRWIAPVAGFKHMHPVSGWSDPAPDTKLQTSTSFSLLSFDWFRDQTAVAMDVFAFAPLRELKVRVQGVTEISPSGQLVSGGYFRGLGVQPGWGRLLSDKDDQAGSAPVAVISDRFWLRRFSRDPEILGRGIEINGVPCTIIGVTPPDFAGTLQVGESPDVFVPLTQVAAFWPQIAFFMKQPWRFWFVQVMGRLHPGVSAIQAQASLEELFRRSALDDQTSGPVPSPVDIRPVDAPELQLLPGERGLFQMRRTYVKPLGILQGLAAMVLFVACLNVANLLLARGASRRKEIATRLALGAGRARIVRQLLLESALLAGSGTLLGLGLAWWGKDWLVTMNALGAGTQSLILHPQLDLPVLGFTVAAALLTTLSFGLVPAWRATRLDLRAEFAGGTCGPALPGARLGRMLMVWQVALSLMLLFGAGLLGRTLRNLRQTDIGFNREELALFCLDASGTDRSPGQLAALYDGIAAQIAGLPEVRSVSYSSVPVLSDSRDGTTLSIVGDASPSPRTVSPMLNVVTGEFFETLQMHLLAGRSFDRRDAPDSPPTAVVNESLARELFGPVSPLGRHVIRRGKPTEIVGVVNDARYADVRDAVPPTIYLAFSQNPPDPQGGPGAGQANFIVRTTGEMGTLLQAIHAVVRADHPDLPLINMRKQVQQIDRQIAQQVLFARLSGAFGVMVTLLVGIGLYGLISYAVFRRTGEIGIRMALGSLPGQVLRMILRDSLSLVLLGVLFGLGGALATGRFLAGRLYGLSPTDPLTLGGAALSLVAVAFFASWLPARRAARVDPVIALRAE